MATNVKKKGVVHTDSGHVAPGPTPAMCLGPPVLPSGTATPGVPFVYVAKSSTGKDGAPKTKIHVNEKMILTLYSVMDVEKPGNQPCKTVPSGMDIVSLAVNKFAVVLVVSSNTIAKYKVALTGDTVALNLVFKESKVFQVQGKFLGKMAFKAIKTAAQAKKNAAKPRPGGDPVSLTTGEVIDEHDDLTLPGRIPLLWRRIYCSSLAGDPSPLGRGGWTHALHQWIEPEPGGIVLRDEDGREVSLPRIEARTEVFHRGKQLEVTLGGDAVTYEVRDITTRITRCFAPLSPGYARAVLREIRDAWGNRIVLRYNEGLLATVVDTASRELRLTHDDRGRILQVDVWAADAVHQRVTYAYSDAGDLERATDALGHAETYCYDGLHRLVQKTLATKISFNYRYEEDSGRCVKTWGDGGFHGLDIVYDTTLRQTLTHGNPEPRRITWDARGAVLREETFDGDYVEEYVYDDDLYVLEEKNAAGQAATFEYDARGNPTRMVEENGSETLFEYEDDLPVRYVDVDGAMSVTYDHHGAPVAVTDMLGLAYSWTYDGFGRTTGVFGPDGTIWTFAYDAQHNLVATTNALGSVTRYGHDALGRITSRTDPLGRLTRIEYDALGQMTAIIDPDRAAQRFVYDARGNLVEHVSRGGRRFAKEWTGLRSLARDTDSTGQAWEFQYDTFERVRAVKNPKGESFELRYDRAGRVIETIDFDGAVTRFQHLRTGMLGRIELPDDAWREFIYDDAGNLVAENSPHGAQTFVHDARGLLIESNVEDYDRTITVQIERDEHGRIVADIQGGRAVRYEYDARGRRAARILPTGETTRYFYDLVGDLVGIDHQGYKLLIQRDGAGREFRRHLYKAGVDIGVAFDVKNQITSQWIVGPRVNGAGEPLVLAQRAYTYDLDGRPTSLTDPRFGVAHFVHDERDQLTELAQPGSREIFEYDAAGSLSDVISDPDQAGHPWAIGTGNLLRRTREARFEYDAGKRRRRRFSVGAEGSPRAETGYLWDVRGRLREVHLPGGEKVHLSYDAYGRRVRKVIMPPPGEGAPPPRIVEFLWDGDALAAEIDSERGTRVFVTEPDSVTPVLQQEQGHVYAVVVDRVGVPKELVDEGGKIAWSASHSAWGEVVTTFRDPAAVKAARPVEPPFRLLGHYLDDETGLYCTRYRYFDPGVARWLSPDPLGYSGGANLFGWNGAPTLALDPLGLTRQWDLGTYSGFQGSGFEGHEMTRHSWLMQQGLAGNTRGGTPFSRDNPSVGLDEGTHDDVHKLDGKVGQDYKKYKNQTANETIDKSIKGMEEHGKMSKKKIKKLRAMAKKAAPKWVCK